MNAAQFQTVGIIARRTRPDVAETVTNLTQTLLGLGAHVVLEDTTAEFIGQHSKAAIDLPCMSRETLGKSCQLIVVVGGDGSLLGVARDLAHTGVPVVGVNRGGLGFLASVSPDAIQTQMETVWSGDYTLEDHFLLQAEVTRGGEVVSTSRALNDVVVHAGSLARMIEFELWVDEEYVYEQRSDGVIVASPTGSTAYALSAGGPIMHPGLDAIVIVPMFPHTLTSRPLVIRGDSVTRIKVTNTNQRRPQGVSAQISCDSQVNASLNIGDEITVRKYHAPLRLLYPAGRSFYESCRSKLDWATRLGGQSL